MSAKCCLSKLLLKTNKHHHPPKAIISPFFVKYIIMTASQVHFQTTTV